MLWSPHEYGQNEAGLFQPAQVATPDSSVSFQTHQLASQETGMTNNEPIEECSIKNHMSVGEHFVNRPLWRGASKKRDPKSQRVFAFLNARVTVKAPQLQVKCCQVLMSQSVTTKNNTQSCSSDCRKVWLWRHMGTGGMQLNEKRMVVQNSTALPLPAPN